MMLTKKKRLYAEARESGKNITESAIYAGCPEKTARSAGSRMEKDADVIAARERLQAGSWKEKGQVESEASVEPKASTDTSECQVDDPIVYLTRVMNDAGEDPKLRADAAKALLPYKHAKIGEKGKKETREEAAKKAATVSRFRPRAVN